MITEIERRLNKELLGGNLVEYHGYLWGEDDDISHSAPWSPLQLIGDAMQLIEIMRKRGYHIVIASCKGCMGQTGEWSVDIIHDDIDDVAMVHRDTLPEAICFAIVQMLDLHKPKE